MRGQSLRRRDLAAPSSQYNHAKGGSEVRKPDHREISARHGAGEGNRTLVCSLGSCRSTIELHPHIVECGADSNTSDLSKVITLIINGVSRQLPLNTTVAALIEEMGFVGKRIAIERNGDIVPRSTFVTQTLVDGDKLEIVVAVGGG